MIRKKRNTRRRRTSVSIESSSLPEETTTKRGWTKPTIEEIQPEPPATAASDTNIQRLVGFINGDIFRSAVADVVATEIEKVRGKALASLITGPGPVDYSRCYVGDPPGTIGGGQLHGGPIQSLGAQGPPNPPQAAPTVEVVFSDYQNCFMACNKIRETIRGLRMKMIETDPRSSSAYELGAQINELLAQLCGNTKTMIDLANV